MSRSKRLWASVGLTAGTAIAIVGITAGTALAATPTFTTYTSHQTTGTLAYTATTGAGTSSAPKITLVDTTAGVNLNCISGTAAGVFKLGKNISGSKIASITGTTWNTCTGPLGITLAVKQVGSWYVNATTKTSSGGKTPGNISNVTATVSETPTASNCEFTVTGSTSASYFNSSGTLAVAPITGSSHVLTISKVTGCFGLINNGDNATFTGTYATSTNNGRIQVTSP